MRRTMDPISIVFSHSEIVTALSDHVHSSIQVNMNERGDVIKWEGIES